MKRLNIVILIFFLPVLLFSEGYIYRDGKTIETRFLLPKRFKRVKVKIGSFQEYLRNLPLKKYGEKVRYYDGRIKNNDVYESVVNMDIGTKDLVQCADAIIKLRGEYLYNREEYDKIGFHITNGMYVTFRKWSEGYRVKVAGSNTKWVQGGNKGTGRKIFEGYLEFIFSYAGTLSLSRELKRVDEDSIDIGDIFIIGGSPGHAVLVVDLAENQRTKVKIFLLAQSYMPAQEIHILKSNELISPWYRIHKGEDLITPEWVFEYGSLKRFE